MANTPPLSIRDTPVADAIDLVALEAALLAQPEALYIFPSYVSTSYGPKSRRSGSKRRIRRLLPLTSPAAGDAHLASDNLETKSVTPGDYLALDHTYVDIQCRVRTMDKPVAEKFETEEMSEADLQMEHQVAIVRHYNEFSDNFCRDEIRARICTNIWGAARTSAANILATDKLTVAMLKEFTRRASEFYLRSFGSQPGADAQALAGSFVGITDRAGTNQLTEDPLWRDYVIRRQGEEPRITKGYVGEIEQVTVIRSDRMLKTNVGPSGNPFQGHEILFLAPDPILVDTGMIDAQGNPVQGFVGEFPVAKAQLGNPWIAKASEDNYGQDLMYKWFVNSGITSTETMAADVATALTALLGGNSDTSKGVANTGSSRFIHRGLFVA